MSNTEKIVALDIDELDEDPVISTQKYLVLSYAFSEKEDRTGEKLPMIKVRGSYSSLEECDKRIKKLDQYSRDPKCIPLLKTEVGKWVGLYPYEDLYKNENIDIEYKEKFMNEAMKGLRESHERANDKFMDRVKKDVEEIKTNSTKEGQEKLNAQKEHPVSVINRYQTYEHQVKVLRAKLEESEKNMKDAEEKLKTYTKEEIDEAYDTIKKAQDQSVEAGSSSKA